MNVRYAPVVYGRTYQVDFMERFLAQPDFFTLDDTAFALSVVQSSLCFFDNVGDDGRRVVFGNGRIAVTGKTIKFEQLMNAAGMEPRFNVLDHENGRAAYGFVGVAVLVDETTEAFEVSDAFLAELYCEHIEKWWMKGPADPELQRTNPVPMKNGSFAPASVARMDIPELEAYAGGILALDSIPDSREGIAAKVLSMTLKGMRVSFCSDVDGMNQGYRERFQIVTCDEPERYLMPTMQKRTQADEAQDQWAVLPRIKKRAYGSEFKKEKYDLERHLRQFIRRAIASLGIKL